MEPGGSPGEDWGGARGYRNRPELRAWFTSAALSASYAVQTAGTNELQDCSAAVLREWRQEFRLGPRFASVAAHWISVDKPTESHTGALLEPALWALRSTARGQERDNATL